ncbi:MAG: UDP-3-O-acyl-N-acetylglucosamine deacetylase [Aestuariivita sp.]|nr:UDP-3-O-acyl-N-acetylglucosamine deacetylase [Aestuariivita sp.]MCY4202417.1 UDP-3-O-acyl-N-acetylglucosamine deacetylase [Aestuariivita sp.]MCY4288644.1 UDP-3-O-acyl-N-acetylglucosamine deacetylase [Aestuariivita sp.]MCY4345585.1 UDP-3-O-acyl-N-acetylglucosamine deacetylase [Aestuariivita sp.]
MQHTVKSEIEFQGVGLHRGYPVKMVIKPAPAGHGIWFFRTDVDRRKALIPALWNAVRSTHLCTSLMNDDGVEVSTVEHVLAALSGCNVQNAIIEIDAPEVPILDGSAAPFVRAIVSCGLQTLDKPVRAIKVLKKIKIEKDGSEAELLPSDTLRIEFQIDFANCAIGQQAKKLTMNNGAFARELSDSRTFCRKSDIPPMLASGMAKGGSSGENAVVFDSQGVISPGGLRHQDEPVRHKMLDAFGDLMLAGGPVLACYRGKRPSHGLTNALLQKLFSTPGAFEIVDCNPVIAAQLPGVGLLPHEVPASDEDAKHF